jgi:hypothetical protein
MATRCGIPQPTLNQIISSPITHRINESSLDAVTHNWPTSAACIRVLIAHLCDEISRAGWDPKNTIEMAPIGGKKITPMTTDDEHLEVLRAHLSDADVAEFIARFANILRRADEAKKYPETSTKEWGNAADPHIQINHKS